MSDKKLYGIKLKMRPYIPATFSLDLSGEQGKQIILSETKLALKTHKKTFKKLASENVIQIKKTHKKA